LVVAGLCRRRKKTQRNTEKYRRLMERVKWLCDLLQLLRSSVAAAADDDGRRPGTYYYGQAPSNEIPCRISQFLQIRGKSVHAMANEDEQIPDFLYEEGDLAQLCSEVETGRILGF
jgi:hypothetical protein